VYDALRLSHVWLAWVSIGIAAGALVPDLGRPPDRAAAVRTRCERILGVLLACQVVVAAWLHVKYSPFTAGVRANLDVIVGEPTLRLWNVIHPLAGLVALALGLWWITGGRRSTAPHTQFGVVVIVALLMAALPWAG
jgi:hypothetical protein